MTEPTDQAATAELSRYAIRYQPLFQTLEKMDVHSPACRRYCRSDAPFRHPRLPICARLICCGREICSGGGQSISGSPAAEYSSSDNDSGMSTGNSSPLELSASCAPWIWASMIG